MTSPSSLLPANVQLFRSLQENNKRHISYSLFGDPRLTSSDLDAVEEVVEEEPHDSSSESEDDFPTCSDRTVDEKYGQEEEESESDCIVIDDGPEIQNILCFIIDQVIDDKETSGPLNNESGYLSPSVSGVVGEVRSEITANADAAVQTDADQERNELIAQVQDLKEAICQQSLQLLESKEQILQMQSAPVKQKQVEDDLQAFRELVHQQSALLKKVTLELEETKRRLNGQVADVSDNLRVSHDDQDTLSEARSESELFDEILIDLSGEGPSPPGLRTSNFLPVSSSDFHSDVRSSTPHIESKVRDVTLKLLQIFYRR